MVEALERSRKKLRRSQMERHINKIESMIKDYTSNHGLLVDISREPETDIETWNITISDGGKMIERLV